MKAVVILFLIVLGGALILAGNEFQCETLTWVGVLAFLPIIRFIHSR